jgi:hypothetical protein
VLGQEPEELCMPGQESELLFIGIDFTTLAFAFKNKYEQ